MVLCVPGRVADPDPHGSAFFGSWIRIWIRIRVKSWIRSLIPIKEKIQNLQKPNTGPFPVDAHSRGLEAQNGAMEVPDPH
jgi:hypothetical protein